MARHGVSDQRKLAAAVQGALRQMAHGERPMHRVRTTEDGRWMVVGVEWADLTSTTHRDALAEARTAMAAMLDVEPSAFDVAADYGVGWTRLKNSTMAAVSSENAQRSVARPSRMWKISVVLYTSTSSPRVAVAVPSATAWSSLASTS